MDYKLIATTFYGLEEMLFEELENLGAKELKKGVRCVYFKGDLGFVYKANLKLRLAIRVLKIIDSFYIKDEKALYNSIYKMHWEEYLSVNETFQISAVLNSETFTHSQYIIFKVKDGLVDRFRDKVGKRPSVGFDSSTLKIHVHIQNNYCSVSLDSSGNSLNQRGYRKFTNQAPINEVLAAGMIKLSDWDFKMDFVDPMCGSGTFLIEAAMVANNIPPNINRASFAFQNWKNYDERLFLIIKKGLLKRITNNSVKIAGFDIDDDVLEKAKKNIAQANLEDFITIGKRDFFEQKEKSNRPVLLLYNPPYDERLKIPFEEFYKKMGDSLKHNHTRASVWFITSNLTALKFVELKPSRKIKLYNGKLESKFLNYKIYEGNKKNKYICKK